MKLFVFILLGTIFIHFSIQQVIICPGNIICSEDECETKNPCAVIGQCFIETCGCSALCSCASNSNCFSNEYCRIYNLTTNVSSCTRYAHEGQVCGGNFLPTAVNVCSPELKCILTNADTSGFCRYPCQQSSDCPSGRNFYCSQIASVNGGYCRVYYEPHSTTSYNNDTSNASDLYLPITLLILLSVNYLFMI